MITAHTKDYKDGSDKPWALNLQIQKQAVGYPMTMQYGKLLEHDHVMSR